MVKCFTCSCTRLERVKWYTVVYNSSSIHRDLSQQTTNKCVVENFIKSITFRTEEAILQYFLGNLKEIVLVTDVKVWIMNK